MDGKPLITPKTRVLQLLEAYPQLEELLIGIVPAFSRLRNPLLRRTVARVATLQQAAAVGGVRVEDLINRLRREVGQDLMPGSDDPGYQTARPAWFDPAKVARELDAAPMLAAGEQPVNQAMAELAALAPGAIYKLSAPFLPAPLIDKGASLGLEHWLVKENGESFTVYFYKNKPDPESRRP